jgi:ribosomal protein S18 acetylase RimI-like enzyme
MLMALDAKPTIQFRRANPNDAAAMTELINSVYRGEESKAQWTTEAHLLEGTRITEEELLHLIKNPEVHFLLMEQNGELIGSVELMQKIQNKIYLGMLSIRSKLQAQGLGRKLVMAAENYAKTELKGTTMTMYVIESRHELINWYVRQGYVDTGERVPFPREERAELDRVLVDKIDFLIMEKSLYPS